VLVCVIASHAISPIDHSCVVGCCTGRQRVPLMMYFHAHYFFVTYHTLSIIVIRRVRGVALAYTGSGGAGALAVELLAFSGTALFFAWLEIKMTTLDAIKEQFNYADMEWALSWGAALYSCYFMCSFPMVYGLDELPGMEARWGLRRTLESALAAGMLGFICLDVVTQFVIGHKV
jgi:cycloeucalenol cycloisomerase